MTRQPTSAWERLRRSLVRVGVLLLIGAAILVVLAMIFEERFIFFPTSAESEWLPPRGYSFVPEDVELVASDGVKLHGWWATSETAPEGPVVLFFHGNAGNLSYRGPFVDALVGQGLRVLIIDYRGYGRSEGRPNEAGVYLDAEAAWAWLTQQRGIDPAHIVIAGRSLGGGVACEMAVRHPEAAGLILESTFRSVPDIAARVYPFLPVRLIMNTRFANLEKVKQVTLPVLVIHGTADEVIPFSEGEALQAAVPAPYRRPLVRIPGGRHNDTWVRGGDSYLEGVGTFVHECAGKGATP